MSLSKKMQVLLDHARSFGLSETDCNTAKEFLEYNEYALCLDTIITQMFEYEIHINQMFYDLIVEIAKKMDLKEDEYVAVKDLVIPNPR